MATKAKRHKRPTVVNERARNAKYSACRNLLERNIVDFVLERYAPEAVILHGSRARGTATKHSDWDLYLLTERSNAKMFEAIFAESEGNQLDLVPVPHNISSTRIAKEFDNTLIKARSFYDPNGFAKTLLENAALIYKRGRNLTPEEILWRKCHLRKCLDRLLDHEVNSGLFTLSLGVFVKASYRYWYEILHNKWPLSAQEAFEDIALRDEEFGRALRGLYSGNNPKVLLASAQQVYGILFGAGSGVFKTGVVKSSAP